MKFGEKLEVYAVPEWADKYVRYKALKTWLKRRQAQLQRGNSRLLALPLSPTVEPTAVGSPPTLALPSLEPEVLSAVKVRNPETVSLLPQGPVYSNTRQGTAVRRAHPFTTDSCLYPLLNHPTGDPSRNSYSAEFPSNVLDRNTNENIRAEVPVSIDSAAHSSKDASRTEAPNFNSGAKALNVAGEHEEFLAKVGVGGFHTDVPHDKRLGPDATEEQQLRSSILFGPQPLDGPSPSDKASLLPALPSKQLPHEATRVCLALPGPPDSVIVSVNVPPESEVSVSPSLSVSARETDPQQSPNSSRKLEPDVLDQRVMFEFEGKVELEVQKIKHHFLSEMQFLLDRLHGVELELHDLLGPPEKTPALAKPTCPALLPHLASSEALVDRALRVDTPDPSGALGFSPVSESPSYAGMHKRSTTNPVGEAPTTLQHPVLITGGTPTHKVESKTDGVRIAGHCLRLQRAVLGIWDAVEKLEGFVNLNMMALYKIYKKRDKMLGMTTQFKDFENRRQQLLDLRVHARTKNKLLDVYKRASGEGRTSIHSLQDLEAAVQRDFLKAMRPDTSLVYFSIGALVVLALDLLVVCVVPATSPNYSIDAAIVVVPIFRFFLMLNLLSWGIGAAMSAMESFGVNYKFILEIDPKCHVSASTVFTFASFQSFVWILVALLAIADLKFNVWRTATREWLYALVLTVAETMLFLIPNKTFRFRYRRNLMYCIWQVLCTCVMPVREVTLVQNVVGDILTSFTKPVGDCEYTVWYFSTAIFSPSAHNQSYSIRGPRALFRTFLLGLPYWLRFMQCFSRYRHDKPGSMHNVHLANMGKYAAGIAVVLCTAIPWFVFAEIFTQRFWSTAG
eukprot:GHVT01043465.1.p1 GENE.GHVT01043465.1~~GHVT01043465.1.p1  ORF type:complete len:848 (+),score=82.63 GHVT01043465.1:344-2887(+)